MSSSFLCLFLSVCLLFSNIPLSLSASSSPRFPSQGSYDFVLTAGSSSLTQTGTLYYNQLSSPSVSYRTEQVGNGLYSIEQWTVNNTVTLTSYTIVSTLPNQCHVASQPVSPPSSSCATSAPSSTQCPSNSPLSGQSCWLMTSKCSYGTLQLYFDMQKGLPVYSSLQGPSPFTETYTNWNTTAPASSYFIIPSQCTQQSEEEGRRGEREHNMFNEKIEALMSTRVASYSPLISREILEQ